MIICNTCTIGYILPDSPCRVFLGCLSTPCGFDISTWRRGFGINHIDLYNINLTDFYVPSPVRTVCPACKGYGYLDYVKYLGVNGNFNGFGEFIPDIEYQSSLSQKFGNRKQK